jgi:hypothetical protein
LQGSNNQQRRGVPHLRCGGEAATAYIDILKGGEMSMPTYLVQVALPAIYVIDAESPDQAKKQAAKRFHKEYHTHVQPEFQWAKLKGSATDAEWEIAEWGELAL